jgi:hypothetical protein
MELINFGSSTLYTISVHIKFKQNSIYFLKLVILQDGKISVNATKNII